MTGTPREAAPVDSGEDDRARVAAGLPVPEAAMVTIVAAVAARPSLWRVALRQVFALARPGWWRRRPYAPLPSPEYVSFRLVTAYGGDGSCGAGELARDVVAYLRWCREGLGEHHR